MRNKNWQKLWTRKFSPYLSSIFMRTFLGKGELTGAKNKLFAPEGKQLHGIYFDSAELKRLIDDYSKKLLKVDLNKYAFWYENEFKSFLNWTVRTVKSISDQMSDKQIIKILTKLDEKLIYFNELQFLPFFLIEGLGREVEALYVDEQVKLRAISTPYKITKIARARIDLLNLCANNKVDAKYLDDYRKKYQWMSVYDFADPAYGLKEIKSMLVGADEAARELAIIRDEQRKGNETYDHFIRTVRDEKLRKKIQIVHYFAYLKEMRDDYRRRAYFLWQPFWKILADRINSDIVGANHLVFAELLNALTKKHNYFDLIKKRRKKYSHWMNEGKLRTFEGKEVDNVVGMIKKVEADKNFLKGNTACKGVTQGVVRIIYHRGEFDKFKTGEVLMTTMTHPEFMIIMKKASAIVTDEGGITSHAAIVSRELKIPCIIGTKIATKVFKDGDMVEVDADNGIVKKIKK